jgi:beta-lactamase superfamily II metal-dependent hydrolase
METEQHTFFAALQSEPERQTSDHTNPQAVAHTLTAGGSLRPPRVQHTSASGTLTAHFINVGQVDCSWLHLPNGDDILVDGGKPQAGPTVVAYLSQNGVSDIELLVATHGDADHIGGLLDVLSSIDVQQAWLDG